MATATSEVQPIERVSVTQPRWRWYHAVVFYGVVQILTFGLSGLVSLARGNKSQSLREATFGDVSYFERLKQVKITPPSWAFGPAWLVNNIAVIWGTWQVLNKPRQTPGRTAYLALQGASLDRLRAVQCRLLQPAFAAQCPGVDVGHVLADYRERGGSDLPAEGYQGGALPGDAVPLVARGTDGCDLSGAVEQG